MLKRFFSIFYRDLHWKLISLLAAFVLWFLAVNMNNPIQNQTVIGRLALHNLDVLPHGGIMLINEYDVRNLDIQVVVRASRSDLGVLSNAMMTDRDLFLDMLQLSVDFRAINPDVVLAADGISTIRLDISANLYPGFEHMSIRPGYVEIMVDGIARESFFVEVIPIGDVMPGHEMLSATLSNNIITLTAARTDMQSIGSVRAYVDVTGITGDAEQVVQIYVHDYFGTDITERVRLSVIETTATMRVWPVGQADILLRTQGEPAPGFAVADVVLETDSVEVVFVGGEDADLHIEIEVTVDLALAQTDMEVLLNLNDWLPDGVILRPGALPEITAFVIVEPIEHRTINVPLDNVRIRGVSAVYQITSDEPYIAVSVSGPRSSVQEMSALDVDLELDLRARQIGTHTVPLTVGLPMGMTVAGAVPAMQVQIHAPALDGDAETEDSPPQEIPAEEHPPEVDDEPAADDPEQADEENEPLGGED